MLNQEAKQLFRELNEYMNKWEDYGVRPNDVRFAENMLEQFYEWTGKEPKEDDRFNTRLKLTQDQEEELIDIAKQMVEKDFLYDPDELFSKYQKVQGKHGIDSFEKYVKFLDEKHIFSQEQILSSTMSYYEYEKLMERARKKGVSIEKLNEDITYFYLEEGLKGETLYEFIYKNI